MATVVDLITYPVKGCAGTSVDSTHLTPAGLAHDRSFMVVGVDGVFRTQRRDPRLALVRPTVSADGSRLTLVSTEPDSGHGALHLDVTTSAPRRDVDLFGATYQGIDQGDEAAAWLTEFLGAPSPSGPRTAGARPEDRRPDPRTSGYADSSAVHLLSRASLAHLAHAVGRARRPAPGHG
ncbi:hypothetical protein GA0115255_123201, partial [Streptomyces sp. Ncost-T6T-2b]